MPRLSASPRFLKAYELATRRDADLRARVNRAVEFFRDDPRHPGLNFEKLRGGEYFSIRVNQGFRIILRALDDDGFELADLGAHDIYRRYG